MPWEASRSASTHQTPPAGAPMKPLSPLPPGMYWVWRNSTGTGVAPTGGGTDDSNDLSGFKPIVIPGGTKPADTSIAIKPQDFQGPSIDEKGSYKDPNVLLTPEHAANQKTADQTLRLSRQADALNNRLYWRPRYSNAAIGSFQLQGQEGGAYQMPQIQTAETRAQERREGYEAAGLSDAMSRARAEFDKNLDLRVENEQFKTFLRLAETNYVAAQAYMQKIAPGAVMPGMMDWMWGNASQEKFKQLMQSGLSKEQAAMQLFEYSFELQLRQLAAMGRVSENAIKEIIDYFKNMGGGNAPN